jgi:hypothetical protein
MAFERARYPANWPTLALQIKTEANWTCQVCGRACRRADETWAQFCQRMNWSPADAARQQRRHYVLTASHTDQDPGNNDRANLRALCAPCHLRFDSRFRATQKRLIAEFYGQQRIDDPTSEGLQLSVLPERVAPFSVPFRGEAPREGKALSPPERPLQTAEVAATMTLESCSGGDGQKARRHTPKGAASGWIETRQGNLKRSVPHISYYYRWEDDGITRSKYIKKRRLAQVEEMIQQRRSIPEILAVLKG